MAKRNANKKNFLFTGILIILALIIAFSRGDFLDTNKNVTLGNEQIGIYYLDVGQGNCAVIQSGNEAVLIDSGIKNKSSKVLDFLQEKGISTLKYVIATHTDTDHIGSMSAIIQNVKTVKFIMPYIEKRFLPTTDIFLNLLEDLDKENVDTDFLKNNTQFNFGEVRLDILVPVEQDEDMNAMSLFIKVTYGNERFLFIGDAQKSEINDIMSANPKFDFSSDIMLMGHHGSKHSLDTAFLSKVDMTYAVISCAENNKYGHPHKEVLNYLKQNNMKSFITYQTGTISVLTDGEKLNITTEKGN